MARRVSAGLLGYAAFLLLIQDLAEPALALAWFAVTSLVALVVGLSGELLHGVAAVVTDQTFLVDRVLPLLLALATVELVLVGRWLLRPLIDTHQADSSPARRAADVVKLGRSSRATEPEPGRKAAA